MTGAEIGAAGALVMMLVALLVALVPFLLFVSLWMRVGRIEQATEEEVALLREAVELLKKNGTVVREVRPPAPSFRSS